jgi:hypothetical protein
MGFCLNIARCLKKAYFNGIIIQIFAKIKKETAKKRAKKLKKSQKCKIDCTERNDGRQKPQKH